MKICKLFSLLLFSASLAIAQQPQSTDPLFNANATTVNGVAPGYWPTAGAGLVLNVSPGTSFCTQIRTYAGGTLTMTANTTNYIYLNTAASCAPATKTTIFASSDIPIATVTTGASSITSVLDVRTHFFQPSSGGGSVGPSSQYWTPYFDTTTTLKGQPLGMPVVSWGMVVNDNSTTAKVGNQIALQKALNWAFDNQQCYNSGQCYQIMPLQLPAGNIYLAGPVSFRGETMLGMGKYSTFIFGGPTSDILLSPDKANSAFTSGTYTSGGTITGAAGQTCTLSNFNNQNAGVITTVTLTGTNAIAGGTALTVVERGGGSVATPTAATLSNGTATCSGTAVVAVVNSTTIPRKCCMTGGELGNFQTLIDSSADANTAGTLANQAAWAAQGRGSFAGSDFANYLGAGWVGQTASGAYLSTDSTIGLTLAVTSLTNFHTGVANIGWVQDVNTGEFMRYRGIKYAGCPNSAPACLLNVTRGVTLAGITSTATAIANGDSIQPVNPLAPANTTDWIPGRIVGACAIVFPGRDGNFQNGSPFQRGYIHDIYFNTYGNSHSWAYYNTCGMYVTGPTYEITMKGIAATNIQHGIIQAPYFTNNDFVQGNGASSDGMYFGNLSINATYPFVYYMGGRSTISHAVMYAGGSDAEQSIGFTLYQVPCHVYTPCIPSPQSEWLVDHLYHEWNNGSVVTTGVYPPMQQIGGYSQKFVQGFMNTPGNVGPSDWSLSDSEVTMTLGTIQINGSQNKFYGNSANGSTTLVGNNGFDNKVTDSSSQYGNRTINYVLERLPMGQLRPDFAKLGETNCVNGGCFQSSEDMMITPEDLINNGPIATTGTLVVDSTAPLTGRYVLVAAPGTVGNVGIDGNNGMISGQRFPKTKGMVYVTVRSPSAGTQFVHLDCQSGTAGGATITYVANTWQTFGFAFDSSAVGAPCPQGGNGGIIKFDAHSASAAINIAHEQIVPNFENIYANGTVFSAGLTSTGPVSGTTATFNNTTVNGNLTVTGTVTTPPGAFTALAPLILLPPANNQIPLILDTQSGQSVAILQVKLNGTLQQQINQNADWVCMKSTCTYYSNGGTVNWSMNSFGDFQLSTGAKFNGSSDLLLPNASTYTWAAQDLFLLRGSAGNLQVGYSKFGTINGNITTNSHTGQFINLNQAQPSGSVPTATLTGSAGSTTVSYYGCYFDINNQPIGCTPIKTVVNAPATPISTNYYNITAPLVPSAYFTQVCRGTGYATVGFIGSRATSSSVTVNDTTGSTFLAGDGTTCPVANTSLAGFRMGAMTDQPGTASVNNIWVDSNFRLAFNDNNTGKKSVVGIATAATAGHYATFASNGKDIVDGGTGSGGVTTINTVAGAFTFTGGGVSCASTTCTFTSGAPTLPSATDTKDTVQVDSGGAASILTPATTGTWEAVQNGGADNTGSVDASSILNAQLTTMCASSTPTRLHLAAGTYKVNSGLLMSATSTTCKGVVIEGDGSDNTILQTNCSGNPYGIWFNNTTNSGEHYNGPTLRHLKVSLTGGTACTRGIQLTQTARFNVDDVQVTGVTGQTYSTGTVSSSGSTITGSGTTFTSAMVHGILAVTSGNNTTRAEICGFTSTTSLTLCSTAFPTGSLSGASYGILYGADGLALDGGFSWTQYGSIKDSYFTGNGIGVHAWGSTSGGVSRVEISGRRDYTSPNPGGRITDAIGLYWGKGSDTLDWHASINNVAACVVLESSHGNTISGECENGGTLTPVTTCNGGTASQACLAAYEANSDTNGHGWSNLFSGPYAYVVGNVYQFDNSAGAYNSTILAPKDLNGQYTNHYVFSGTAGCPSSTTATIIAPDCNTSTVLQAIRWTFGDKVTGAALTTAEVGYVTLPAACNLYGWHIMADAGTATIKTWRVNGGTALPTSGNSISTSGVSLSSGTKVDSTTLSDFTSTSFAANDTLGFAITAVSTAKQITFQLDCGQ